METGPDKQELTPSEQAELERLNKAFTPAHYDAFENELYIYARVRGWTGDPFQQPARVVLSIARHVFQNPKP